MNEQEGIALALVVANLENFAGQWEFAAGAASMIGHPEKGKDATMFARQLRDTAKMLGKLFPESHEPVRSMRVPMILQAIEGEKA